MVHPGAIPFSSPPKLSAKELERSKIQIALYKKEITPEEATAMGYVPDEPWGMSELRPDEVK